MNNAPICHSERSEESAAWFRKVRRFQKHGGIVSRLLWGSLIVALTAFSVTRTSSGAPPESSAIQFRDVTQQAGVHFVHNNGAFGKKYLDRKSTRLNSSHEWISY